MESGVICPYSIPEKIGYLTKKDNYSQIYLESQEDINLRDLVYQYDLEDILKNKFQLEPLE